MPRLRLSDHNRHSGFKHIYCGVSKFKWEGFGLLRVDQDGRPTDIGSIMLRRKHLRVEKASIQLSGMYGMDPSNGHWFLEP